jgi:predicted amidophosphoribosyltransferase
MPADTPANQTPAQTTSTSEAPPDPSARFSWPPREAAPGVRRPEQAVDPISFAAHPSRWAALGESIETELLGRTALSFDRWAQRTGWAPDARGSYCWRCAGSVGPHETDGEGCADCRGKKLPWDRALRLGIYQNELREEVLALKFHGWRPGGHGLGRIMGQAISSELNNAQTSPARVRLVPIPTHPLRRILRGVDHTMVLTRGASAESMCPAARVLRARYRPEQVGLSATARAANIRDAFKPDVRRLSRAYGPNRSSEGEQPEGVRVWVLIDDVRTTGATFVAAARALRKGLKAMQPKASPAEIWVCCVGVAGSRSRRDLNTSPNPEA